MGRGGGQRVGSAPCAIFAKRVISWEARSQEAVERKNVDWMRASMARRGQLGAIRENP